MNCGLAGGFRTRIGALSGRGVSQTLRPTRPASRHSASSNRSATALPPISGRCTKTAPAGACPGAGETCDNRSVTGVNTE